MITRFHANQYKSLNRQIICHTFALPNKAFPMLAFAVVMHSIDSDCNPDQSLFSFATFTCVHFYVGFDCKSHLMFQLFGVFISERNPF